MAPLLEALEKLLNTLSFKFILYKMGVIVPT